MTTQIPADSLQICATRIDASIRNVFAQLDELAGELRDLWLRLQAEGRRPSSRDLRALAPLINTTLAEHNWLCGTGVVLEAGELSDRELHLEWHSHGADGRPTPMPLNVNRQSERFYNYQKMPWFNTPRSSGQPWVDGPFVDLYGADLYILAFSLPILLDGRFIGVAVADVAMQDFERVLLSNLLRLDREAVIINGEGRVLAANTAHWCTGEMIRSFGQQRTLQLEGAARWALVECMPKVA
ncbi:MAG: histidine kinase [Pseudomonas sp. PGPPP3]|jgi:hypothetical protein|nr:MAG: histidine kinase [Pseudomonas sp. PGPPP3]